MNELSRGTMLTHSIREILLGRWDPIGVRAYLATDYDSVKDEYDAYIPEVEKIILSNGSVEEMEVFLAKAEKEQVPGIKPSDRSKVSAKLLCDLKKSGEAPGRTDSRSHPAQA